MWPRVEFGSYALEDNEGDLAVVAIGGETRTVGADHALVVLYDAAAGRAERVPKKAPDGTEVDHTTRAEVELALQLMMAQRAGVRDAAESLLLAIGDSATEKGGVAARRAALGAAVAEELFASAAPGALSSALRRDSLDFRVDGEVRCRLGFDESRATFSGAAGARVALGGLADPQHEHEAATKRYVDSVASGLTVKGSVQYVVTGNLDAAYAADNMQLVGQAAFGELLASLFDLDPEDGARVGQHTAEGIVASNDERVATKFLVNAQTNKRQNGVYFLAQSEPAWTLQRCASLFDASNGNGELKPGSFVFVERGHRKANYGFVLVSRAGEATVRTRGDNASDVTFEQFSGAGQLSAGTNVNKVGDTINLNAEIDVSEVETGALRVRQDAFIGGRAVVGAPPSVAPDAAALVVGGEAYVHERLTVGAAAVVGGSMSVRSKLSVSGELEARSLAVDQGARVRGGLEASANGATMRVEEARFGVRVNQGVDEARMDLESDALRIGGVQKVLLAGGGYCQEGDGTNVYAGRTMQRRPMLVESAAGKSRVAFGDDGEWTWTGTQQVATAGGGDDYAGSTLVVEGKAFVDGRLVVAGDGGARVCGDVALDSALTVAGKATVRSGADIHGRAFVGCGATSAPKDWSSTTEPWSDAALVVGGGTYVDESLVVDGTALVHGDVALGGCLSVQGKTFVGCDALGDGAPGWSDAPTPSSRASNDAALIVGGKTYVDGALVVNAGGGTGASALTGMILDASLGFQLGVPNKRGGFACIELGDDFVIEGAREVHLKNGGIRQSEAGAETRNVFHAHTAHRAPVSIVASVDDGRGASLEYDAASRSWTRKGAGGEAVAMTPGTSDDFTNASLVVDGKAFLTGRLVVTGDGGACIHGDVDLDSKLLVGGAARRLMSEMPAKRKESTTLLVDGGAHVAGSLHLDGSVASAGLVSSQSVSFTTLLSGNTARLTGDCHARSYYSQSDLGLKRDVRRIEGAVAQCERLRGVEFKWKRGADERDQIGCIAQEVEAVYPSLVSEENGHKSVDYAKLVGLLIEAVRELKAEIVELRAERARAA